jgi:anti-sigma B factor antagonist
MPTTADAYGSMTVLSTEPALTRAEDEVFRRIAAEQIRAGGRWFVLDLSRVGYLDSQGLEALLWFQEQVEAAQGVTTVAGLKGHARRIFEMVRFDKKFDVFENVHEAVKSFH